MTDYSHCGGLLKLWSAVMHQPEAFSYTEVTGCISSILLLNNFVGSMQTEGTDMMDAAIHDGSTYNWTQAGKLKAKKRLRKPSSAKVDFVHK